MTTRKRRMGWGLLLLTAGFFGLFGLRVAYGWWHVPGSTADLPFGGAVDLDLSRKNYASSKLKRPAAGGTTFDQKYERVANAGIASQAFDDDEAKLRSIVAEHRGLVQAEQRSGLAPERRLQLVVGVDPSAFDATVAALQEVGRVTHLELRKTDKTNDYLQLKATRRSLEKSIAALKALPQEGQGLSALVQLEQEILAREKELQEVGVQLGEFDEENEFCTVNVQLLEHRSTATAGPGWPQRLEVAFEWTLPRYFLLLAMLAAAAMAAFFAVLVFERLGVLRAVLLGPDAGEHDQAHTEGGVTGGGTTPAPAPTRP